MKQNNIDLKNKILEFKQKHQSWKNKKIAKYFNISYTKFVYIMTTDERRAKNKEIRDKWINKRKSQKYYTLINKIKNFQKRAICDIDFTYLDVINKFGENPKCYLTGRNINYDDPKTYQLDHILSVNKGGKSNLDNLQLAYPQANEMKRNYDLQEFINLCKEITEYNK